MYKATSATEVNYETIQLSCVHSSSQYRDEEAANTALAGGQAKITFSFEQAQVILKFTHTIIFKFSLQTEIPNFKVYL